MDFAVFTVVSVVFFGLPGLLSALIGRARGGKWYWFMLLGLASWAGPLIADRVARERLPHELSSGTAEEVARVVLTWRSAPEGCEAIGPVEAEVRVPYTGRAGPPDIRLASAALRRRAREMGADGVAEVSYQRRQPSLLVGSHRRLKTMARISASASNSRREERSARLRATSIPRSRQSSRSAKTSPKLSPGS